MKRLAQKDIKEALKLIDEDYQNCSWREAVITRAYRYLRKKLSESKKNSKTKRIRIAYVPVCIKVVDPQDTESLGLFPWDLCDTKEGCRDYAEVRDWGNFKFYPVYADIPKEFVK